MNVRISLAKPQIRNNDRLHPLGLILLRHGEQDVMAQDIPYQGRCVALGIPDSAGRPQDSSRLGFFGETIGPDLRINNPMENILRYWATHGAASLVLPA